MNKPSLDEASDVLFSLLLCVRKLSNASILFPGIVY